LNGDSLFSYLLLLLLLFPALHLTLKINSALSCVVCLVLVAGHAASSIALMPNCARTIASAIGFEAGILVGTEIINKDGPNFAEMRSHRADCRRGLCDRMAVFAGAF
jgi:hypothetical protein